MVMGKAQAEGLVLGLPEVLLRRQGAERMMTQPQICGSHRGHRGRSISQGLWQEETADLSSCVLHTSQTGVDMWNNDGAGGLQETEGTEL